MKYIKVKWLHELKDEPVILLSELDDDRYEVRKIEIFSDGRVGFASGTQEVGGTMLGEVPVPSIDELVADPQFFIEDFSGAKFETAWRLNKE